MRDEVLGGSNGRRDQVFRLASAPVLRDTLRLEIDEGNGRESGRAWTISSAPVPRIMHYVLNRTTGEIRFGDGRQRQHPGRQRRSNPDANVVAREYRFGGGKRGNVPASAIKTLTTSIDGIDDQPGRQSAGRRTAAATRRRSTKRRSARRARSSSRCRAVTAEDFE